MIKRKNNGRYLIVYGILIAGIIVTIFPFLWMILTRGFLPKELCSVTM